MRPWIKLYANRLDDVRLLRLHDRIQLRYFQLYLLAGRLDADGSFVENGKQLDDTDIAIKLRVNDVTQFSKDLKTMKSAGLIKINGHGPLIADFGNEQVDWSRKQEQDRARQDKKRHGVVTRDKSVTGAKSRKVHGSVTSLDQDQTKKEIKKKIQIKKKTTTQPTPSSRKNAKPAKAAAQSVAGGGGKGDSSEPNIDSELQKIIDQNPGAAETMRIMRPILTADGLGKQKFKNLMVKVAIRILPRDAKRFTLAALASAYADPDANNKTMVAVYRLENDQVPLQFMNAATWKVIPDEVLKAAGVDDLNDYVASTGKGVQQKAAVLRARSHQ